MGLRGSLRKPQKVQSPTKYDSYFLLEDSWDGVRPVLEAQVSVLMKDDANAEALQVRRVTRTSLGSYTRFATACNLPNTNVQRTVVGKHRIDDRLPRFQEMSPIIIQCFLERAIFFWLL
jgi:hypothetical protein